MGDELVTVFVGRCPMGEQCSKKHGILTKKATEEEVRKAIHHHLRTSPYHEMAEEDAKGLVELSEIETWTEEAWRWQQGQTEEGDGWYQNRKKQKTRAMDDTAIQAAAWKLVQQQNPLQPHPPFHPPASSSTQERLRLPEAFEHKVRGKRIAVKRSCYQFQSYRPINA